MNVIGPADVVELRRRRGWSQEDLASILGVTVSTVATFEATTHPTAFDLALEERLIMLGAIPGAGGQLAPQVISSAEPSPVQEEQTPAFDRSDGVRRISNSEVQTFKQCRRRWWLSWYRKLALKQEPMVGPRMIGNRIHRALESMYAPGGPFPERAIDEIERIITTDREIMGAVDEITAKQFTSESDLERIMLEGYVQWVEDTGADENLEVVGAERYVEANLQPFTHHGGLKIIGRLDVVVRHRSNGELRFIDHKTLDNFGRVTKTMRIDEQSRHYQLLNWMTNSAGRVGGVIFNMLRRVKRTAKATPPFYAREEITHNRAVMENYYDRLVAEIWEIENVEGALDVGGNHQEIVPPTVSQFCTWGCPFLQICSMFDDGSRVEDAIAAQYEVVDPLSYYDKNKEGDENG